MDVDQRMNQSLDEIIKAGSKKGLGKRTSKGPRARQGPKGLAKGGKVSKQGLNSRAKAEKGAQLGVKRSGVKKAGTGPGKKASKVSIPIPQRSARGRKPALGKAKGAAGNAVTKRAVEGSSGRQRKNPRIVSELSNLRITIENDRAVQQPRYSYAQAPQTGLGPPGYEAPSIGYGPRNLPARQAEAPVTIRQGVSLPARRQPSNDFGVSRRVFGRGPAPPAPRSQRPFRDYDLQNTDSSYMRMDVR